MDGNPEAEEELVGAMQTIQERIKIHDRHQFEIKHVYPLSSQNGRALRYTVELYLFIPQSLDINPESRRKGGVLPRSSVADPLADSRLPSGVASVLRRIDSCPPPGADERAGTAPG
ncbi:MAG: hypothetical protein L6W00_18490 [Lentisphaeria bacterium]|nr:MAG: hypothetical protein L6W00_18490 [Lentisphaeria bacterium]